MSVRLITNLLKVISFHKSMHAMLATLSTPVCCVCCTAEMPHLRVKKIIFSFHSPVYHWMLYRTIFEWYWMRNQVSLSVNSQMWMSILCASMVRESVHYPFMGNMLMLMWLKKRKLLWWWWRRWRVRRAQR